VAWTFPGNYKGSQVKMWSDNYWMFVGQYTQDTVKNDNFGGGSYSLEGVVYKETIVYHVSPDYVGKTLRMRIVVQNDTLVQVWPADEKGEINKSNYRSEKYVRVK
jgi:predicted metal-dependent RNase